MNRRVVLFSFENIIKSDKTEEKYLQITAIDDIGFVDRGITQKIIRLNEEKQRELRGVLNDKIKFNLEEIMYYVITSSEEDQRAILTMLKKKWEK